MTIVGLTGGIGSGKSTVAKIFAILGIPVYDADTHAKFITDNNKDVIEKLKNIFGNDIYSETNKLNRKKLARYIFNNTQLLQKTNAIIHPAVNTDFENWLKNQNSKYVIKEAAILFESGAYKQTQKIITVTAPEEIRIKRLKIRDKANETEILSRIKNQWNDADKINLSDFVIINDDKNLIIPQVINIHKQIINSL